MIVGVVVLDDPTKLAVQLTTLPSAFGIHLPLHREGKKPANGL